MSGLSGFLSANALPCENIKIAVSKRFVGDDGKPLEWELTCITSGEDEVLRKACTKRVQVNGKSGQYTQDMDFNKYMSKLATKCVVSPNLNDAELQNSYGVMGAEELLQAMLKPGEFYTLIGKVQEINGFDQTMGDLVEEAKN